MHATAWITLASLTLYIWIVFMVGRARGKYHISAPQMDGPPEFLYTLRVQANTVEQMVLFLPALWLCASNWGDLPAAAGGAVWVLGRLWYAIAYYRNPAKRGPGFMLSTLATVFLMGGTAWGLLAKA